MVTSLQFFVGESLPFMNFALLAVLMLEQTLAWWFGAGGRFSVPR